MTLHDPAHETPAPITRTHAACDACCGAGRVVFREGPRGDQLVMLKDYVPPARAGWRELAALIRWRSRDDGDRRDTLMTCGTCGGTGELACTRPLDTYEAQHLTGRAP